MVRHAAMIANVGIYAIWGGLARACEWYPALAAVRIRMRACVHAVADTSAVPDPGWTGPVRRQNMHAYTGAIVKAVASSGPLACQSKTQSTDRGSEAGLAL